MDSESVKDRAVESSKREGEEPVQESAKKQKVDEHVQAKAANDDTAKLKRCLEIVSEDDDSSDDKDVDEVLGRGEEGSGIDDQARTNSSTQDVNTAGPSINTANTNINVGSLNINIVGPKDQSMSSLEESGIFDDVYDDREVGAEAGINNLNLSTSYLHVFSLNKNPK
nr:hypothetical protein [Tanacetum cinerariifolium]